MVDTETKVTLKADVEGFGDAERHSIDVEVAETIAQLIRTNLRNRYEHISREDEIDVVTIEPPNNVIVHMREDE